MTDREAIDIIKSECYIFNPINFDRSIMVNTALDMAVKSLEQEPVLYKIREEIERQEKWLLQAGCTAYNMDIAFDAIKSAVAEMEVIA